MKKSLIVLASLAAFAGAASAQSNVTLFGIVDLSINQIKNGSTTTKSMQNNQLSSNRLGFRGEEDLGGGLKAGFWLEAPMTNDNGNAAALNFTRRSTISLMGSFGEIRAGRDYNPQFWNLVFGDVNGANGIGQGFNLVSTLGSGATTAARSNSAVYYFLPGGLGGLTGHFGISDETAAVGAARSGNKHTSARFTYTQGPAQLGIAFGRTDVAKKAGYTADTFGMFNMMANYDFGAAKIYSWYSRNTFDPAKQTAYEVSAGVPMGAGEFRVSMGKQETTGDATQNGSSTLFGTGYVHNLSKRTMIYGGYARINNSGKSGVKIISTDGSAVNTTSSGFNVGLRHAF